MFLAGFGGSLSEIMPLMVKVVITCIVAYIAALDAIEAMTGSERSGGLVLID